MAFGLTPEGQEDYPGVCARVCRVERVRGRDVRGEGPSGGGEEGGPEEGKSLGVTAPAAAWAPPQEPGSRVTSPSVARADLAARLHLPAQGWSLGGRSFQTGASFPVCPAGTAGARPLSKAPLVR